MRNYNRGEFSVGAICCAVRLTGSKAAMTRVRENRRCTNIGDTLRKGGTQFLDGRRVLVQAGQVVPFIWIGFVIVQFFAAIVITDVAPTLRANGIIPTPESH